MNSKKTVSVVLPVYNRESVVKRAIDSVLNQSYSSLELLVVDDGSTDGTVERVRSVSDERLRLIVHPKNRGANAARNTGIEAATGRYVAFMDSDDRWYRRKLERQVVRMQETAEAVRIVHTAFWNMGGFFRQYRPQQKPVVLEGDLSKVLLRHNCLGFVNVLVTRDLLNDTGPMDEKMPALQDWDFHLRASRHAAYAFIDTPLLEKFPRESSISRNYSAYVKAHRRLRSKYKDRFRREPGAMEHFTFRLGSSLCLDDSSREGRIHLSQSLKKAPLNPVYLLAYLLSFFGARLSRMGWSVHSHVRAGIDYLGYQLSDVRSGDIYGSSRPDA